MPDLHQSEVEGKLNELENKLDRLRALYDSFFQGFERTPPLTLRKDVVRIFNELSKVEIRRTALRFRLQMLMQRFSQFKTLWNRTEREIEEGRYRKHRKRAETRDRERTSRGQLPARDLAAIAAIRNRLGDEAAAEAERKRRAAHGLSDPMGQAGAGHIGHVSAGAGLSAGATPSGQPQAGQPSSASASGDGSTDAGQAAADFLASLGGSAPTTKPAKSAANIRGVSSDELRTEADRISFLRDRFGIAAPAQRPAPPKQSDSIDALYSRLMKVRSGLDGGAPAPDPARFRQSVERQAAQLRSKHSGKNVEFDVVVREGRAYIKPILKD